VMIFGVLGFSVPSAWLAYILIFVFSLQLGVLPPTGYEPIQTGLIPFLRSLVLPSLTLGIGTAALIARLTRAALLDVLRQDYIRTARSKGLADRTVLFRHA